VDRLIEKDRVMMNIQIQEEQNDIELIDESGAITEPFDPNLIKIETQSLTLLHIIKRLKSKKLNLFTEFQRRQDIWEPSRQSRLIESILLRLPIPSFYFDGQDDDKWQIVDGLQRVYTLKKFVVDNNLKLEQLELLPKFNGYHYNKLSRDVQRRIKSFPIVVYLIQKNTPAEIKFELFKRINRGGLVLEDQEIRHALNQGIPANYVKELAELEEFKQATCYKIKSEQMKDRDFVTRFISFYLNSYQNYQPNLDNFMNKSMAKITQLSEEQRYKMTEDFTRAMQMAIDIFGNDAFRKRFNPTDRRHPINKALFETLSVNFALLSDIESQKLVEQQDIFRQNLIELMNQDKFERAISSGTGQKEAVETRFGKVQQIINKTL
jgi:hypothetical protein